MGKLPKGPIVAVGLSSAVTIGAIVYSHYSQIQDKAIMRAGVERDKERLRMKRMLRKKQEEEQSLSSRRDLTR